MALLSWKDQQRISAQEIIPERSAAIANTGNGLSTVKRLDVRSTGAERDISCVRNEYVLTIPPGTSPQADFPNINSARVGDICHVFFKDTTDTTTDPNDYAMFVFTGAGTGAKTSNPLTWKKVTIA